MKSKESNISDETETKIISGYGDKPAVIGVTDFHFKSLSDFTFNTAVGCAHGCRFCYVPDAATIKQKDKLAPFGVEDPDAEWGDYVLVRPWDEKKFLSSLNTAENMPPDKL